MTTLSGQTALKNPHTAAWLAPSNIALVKYWGKSGLQIPANPSLSMTLKNARTETRVSVTPSSRREIIFKFENQEKPEFLPKIEAFLERISEFCPWVNKAAFSINSTNTFPHSSGIASSASSMAALALSVTEIDFSLAGITDESHDFLKSASFLARLGSGSASRSVYSGYALWGKHDDVHDSSDEFAIPFQSNIHSRFQNMNDDILIVNPASKSVSSSAGHSLMDTHDFRQSRIKQAVSRTKKLITALETGDMNAFIQITEQEALTLHALMMSSEKPFSLLAPESLSIISAIQDFRKQTDLPVCFTLDAGPNVHVLYPEKDATKVKRFIKSKLSPHCHNGFYLEDQTGEGPKKITRDDA